MIVDVLGERLNPHLSDAIRELDSMIGLREVKLSVKDLMELAGRNYDRELKGEKQDEIPLNRLFLGNPGK